MKKTVFRLKKSIISLLCSSVVMTIMAGCAIPIQSTITPLTLPSESPTLSASPTRMDCLESEADFSDQIRDILENPQQFIGKAVTLVGYYRGWDLLKEAQATSPVTRSDWVIRDRCAAIYVQAMQGVNVGLNPGEQSDTVRVVRVNGIVRISAKGQPYIEPLVVKLVR